MNLPKIALPDFINFFVPINLETTFLDAGDSFLFDGNHPVLGSARIEASALGCPTSRIIGLDRHGVGLTIPVRYTGINVGGLRTNGGFNYHRSWYEALGHASLFQSEGMVQVGLGFRRVGVISEAQYQSAARRMRPRSGFTNPALLGIMAGLALAVGIGCYYLSKPESSPASSQDNPADEGLFASIGNFLSSEEGQTIQTVLDVASYLV